MDATSLELRKFVAPEFVIGTDARLLAGRYAKNFGAQHVLIVTGPNIIQCRVGEGCDGEPRC